MTDDEYLLADKAYEIDKHLITPYMMPIARQPSHKAFNRAHSVERVKIEHAFGVLKARWSNGRTRLSGFSGLRGLTVLGLLREKGNAGWTTGQGQE